ncbi:hypothetical protein B0O99DRAFT_689347 [Bisporella sp. PMI_857]|nr:hypothetical protein B0O99DRAFT_689347 [Bisporella sp. PMI_857]
MPHPVIGPMEHPVQSGRCRKPPPPQLHGGTSLKLSDAGPSPVLEAHPGSPVDISRARRPSLAASLISARSPYGSTQDLSNSERSPKAIGQVEESIGRDDVAAKGLQSTPSVTEEKDHTKSLRRVHLGGMQPFYIPAKVPENEEVSITTRSVHGDDSASVDTAMDHETDLHFETDGGTWITANPIAQESRTSLSSTTTVTSTLMDGSRYSQGLTLDTSVASSAASMMSSTGSTYSASTNPSDIYGWEEELDRKSSIESTNPWERDLARRLPSGGRTHMGPRYHGSHAGKRKSLLYRVLSLSGRRGTALSGGQSTPPEVPPVPSV